jgi:hypothetical protein
MKGFLEMVKAVPPYGTKLVNTRENITREEALHIIGSCLLLMRNAQWLIPEEVNPVYYYLIPALEEIYIGVDPKIALKTNGKKGRPKDIHKLQRDLNFACEVANLIDAGLGRTKAIEKVSGSSQNTRGFETVETAYDTYKNDLTDLP